MAGNLHVFCYMLFVWRRNMISGLNSALSGLQAVGTKVENNANNVANLNSDGFKKGESYSAKGRPRG